MGRGIVEHSLFKPKSSKAETKADVTNHAARAIISDEAARREAKTAKLRQQRLDNETRLAAAPPPAKPVPKKRASAPRAKSSAR